MHKAWYIWQWHELFARYLPLNYTVTFKLGFGVTQGHQSCTIRSADPENLILEPNIMSIGKAVAKLWPFCISKMAVNRHLGFYRTANSTIRCADPKNPSLEPNMEWIRCTVCEILILNYTMTLKLGFGVTQGHRNRHHLIEHIWLYIHLT